MTATIPTWAGQRYPTFRENCNTPATPCAVSTAYCKTLPPPESIAEVWSWRPLRVMILQLSYRGLAWRG
jgi:hypothetical protein